MKVKEFECPRAEDFGFFFKGDSVLYGEDVGCLKRIGDVFPDTTKIDPTHAVLVGRHQDQNLFSIAISEEVEQLIPGRELLKTLDIETSQSLCRSKQLLYWHQSSLYCGSCGSGTKFCEDELAKCCTKCKKLLFPSMSSAIIVLIVKDDQMLLARSPHFPPGMYSTLAGFVEASDSLEDTIHREVKEEVGLNVKNITYFGSQSWPFPNSFMVGFRAEYDSGEIQIDNNEIEDAKWCSPTNLPLLPPSSSIARHLIDDFLNLSKKGEIAHVYASLWRTNLGKRSPLRGDRPNPWTT
jgi:NAD+ diphosphatase